jgi:predicted RNA binding protein YcfA (HicA-like mRNA interferase family)
MRLPRDVRGTELIRKLGHSYGYQITRQDGSHARLTTQRQGEHHVTVPRHDALRVGTLNSILNEVADHFDLSRDQVIQDLFG